MRRQAAAIMERRKRTGEWTGAVTPHHEYAKKPVEWIVKYLGIEEKSIRWSKYPEYKDHEWDGDEDPFVTMLEAIANDKDCGVESGTGTGKTIMAACCTLWYLAVHQNAIVVSGAPKQDQLLLHMWKEIGKLWPRFVKMFPDAKLLTGKLRMLPAKEEDEVWAATAFVAGVGAAEEAATKAQGFHGPRMLWITEETPGMPTPIMKSIRNTRTGMHNPHLALGNPDHRNDPLHQFCEYKRTVAVRVSALDHPNVVINEARDPEWMDIESDVEMVPGAVARSSILERKEEYGEADRMYQSRVRGISPAEAESSIIKWEWCVEAANRYSDMRYRQGLPAFGVDVADSPTGDMAAIASGIGACCLEVMAFHPENANKLGEHVYNLMVTSDPPVRGRNVGVDADGVGAGAVNELKRLGVRARALHGNAKVYATRDPHGIWQQAGDEEDYVPSVIESEQYKNWRAQAHWRLRSDLQHGRIALPYDEELFRDLTTPMKLPGAEIRVEMKDDIKARLGRSPNKGDAVVLWNWVRSRRMIVAEVHETADPNEDTYFEEHMERLAEGHDHSLPQRPSRITRKVRAVRRQK